jgi:hypothetical protein
MAHFALIENEIVTRVEVINNEVIATDKGNDSELKGKRFLVSLYPETTEAQWVQTSYSGAFRGAYAGQGYAWDGTNFTAPAETIPKTEKDATL